MLYQYFRVSIFAVHAVTAIIFLSAAFNTSCTTTLTPAYRSAVTPPRPPGDSIAIYVTNRQTPLYPVVYTPPIRECPPIILEKSLGFITESHESVWCAATRTPHTMEYAEDVTSFVIGSSWNILILIVMFEWITSSYALLYLEEPVIVWSYIPTPPGVHPIPFIATIWNLILLILLWFCRKTFLLPNNNLFLFSALLIATIIMQNYIARPMTSSSSTTSQNKQQDMLTTTAPQPSYGLDTRIAMQGATNEPLVWRTDHFLRQRTAHTPNLSSRVTATAMKYTSLDAAVQPDVPLHRPDYNTNLDAKGEAVAARMMEYSCSAPLLIVGLYLNFTTNALTSTYQLIFASLGVCPGIGIMLHLAVLSLRSASSADRPKLQTAGCLMLIASWLAFVAGFIVYFSTAQYVLTHSEAGAPSWVVGLLWILIGFYSMFGLLVTVCYAPLLMYPPTETPGAKGDADRDEWFQTFDTVVFWLDVFSFVIKLAVAWTVYTKGSIVDCPVFSCT
jgi:hypothetical protein